MTMPTGLLRRHCQHVPNTLGEVVGVHSHEKAYREPAAQE
jgi:hypothetical protein